MTLDTAANELKLRRHEPIPSDEIIEMASDRMDAARKVVPLASPLASAIDDILVQIPTSAIDTLAVMLLPDGFCAQLYNPDFVLRCKTIQDLVFIRTHEIYHVLFQHLWQMGTNRDEIRILAEEAVINDRVSSMYAPNTAPHRWVMPLVLNEHGKEEPTGIHPWKVYERYRKDLRDANLDYVEYDEFISTDLRCEAELRRMKSTPKLGKNAQCVAGPCASGSQSSGGDGGHPHQDTSVMGEVVEGAAERVLKQATEGSDIAKGELLKVMDSSADSDFASEMFGNMGVGALRGETSATRQVSYWQQYLSGMLHERIREGERLVFNEALIAFPGPPRISSIGDETFKKGVIAVDASGSMSPAVLEYIAKLLGEEENLEFSFLSFDAEVWPFKLGDELRGGGGTSFSIIEDYVQTHYDQYPDFVVVVTDGYAPAFTPSEPDRWVWLITEGGDPWPERHDVPMGTVVIDDAELAASADMFS